MVPCRPAPAGDPAREKSWLIAGLLSLAVLAAVGVTWWLATAEAPVRYTTAPVTRGAVTRAVTATGTVNPVLTIIVGTYVSGVIQELHCDYNTQVKNGSDLRQDRSAPLSDRRRPEQSQSRGRPRRSSKRTRPTSPMPSSTRPRSRLVQTNAVSQDTFDNAKSASIRRRRRSRSTRRPSSSAKPQLDAAQVNLDYTDIVSPVDGTVVSRNVTMGQTVAASFQTPTLFLIATDLTKMQVDTNVSESDIGGIKDGNKAHLHRRCLSRSDVRRHRHAGPPVAADRAERRDL